MRAEGYFENSQAPVFDPTFPLLALEALSSRGLDCANNQTREIPWPGHLGRGNENVAPAGVI